VGAAGAGRAGHRDAAGAPPGVAQDRALNIAAALSPSD
jgi:hypothetical protein